MVRTGNLRIVHAVALIFVCTLCIGGADAQQQSSEIEAVKAANQAFYAAFSARDIAAMQKVWSSDAGIQNIGPTNKSISVGWDVIGKGFTGLFDTSPELKASMDQPQVKIAGVVAWVAGLEQVQRKDTAGASITNTNLVTNIFLKQDGRWLLVHHYASRVAVH